MHFRSNVSNGSQDLKNTVSGAEDTLKNVTEKITDELPDGDEVKKWVDDGVGGLKDGLRKAGSVTDGFIRESPYIALACGAVIGLAGGYLIGCAFKNREA